MLKTQEFLFLLPLLLYIFEDLHNEMSKNMQHQIYINLTLNATKMGLPSGLDD